MSRSATEQRVALTQQHAVKCAAFLCGPLVLAACQQVTEDFAFAPMAEMELLSASEEMALARPAAQASVPLQRLIRSGTVRLEVEDLDAAMASATDLATGAQGYVAGSQLNEGREGARTASLVLRVPSDAFESVVDRLPDLGRVLSVAVTSSDVSRDYFDIETRLAVGEETVTRLRQLASRGGDLDDVLAAERELGRAMSELESLKGQLRYFDLRVAESDVSVSLVEPGAVVTSGTFRPVVEAFRNATQVFAQSIAYLVYLTTFLVPWVLVGLLAWPILRKVRRGREESVASEAT